MYACVDLGSNSFHLLIAIRNQGESQIVERFSEKIQLGEGLSARGSISPKAFARGIACLRRFREVIDTYPVERYWALGTNALRVADNAAEFLDAARDVGFEISVISGIQEATLIYAGVVSHLPVSTLPRLVIDIGGGSTELVIGTDNSPSAAFSLPMGCVTWRDDWFDPLPERADQIESQLDKALEAARCVLDPVCEELRNNSWNDAFASSGTAKMLASVCQANNLGAGEISLQSLHQLKPLLIEASLSGELLPGLSALRQDLILPGWSVLTALMQTLGLDTVFFSPAALREGMLEHMVHSKHPFRVPDGSRLPGISQAN